MNRSIFSSKIFGVITFDTTSQALKAEKLLQQMEHNFVMIPTPREISASCGLAIKTNPEEVTEIQVSLQAVDIIISGVYKVDKSGSQPLTEKIKN